MFESGRQMRIQLGAVLLATLVMSNVGFAQRKSGKEIFFLEDDQRRQWCGYSDQSEWKSAVQSLSAMIVGGVAYLKDRVSVIHVTETDESGDWAVYDEYTLDQNGRLQKLKRTINVLPGRITEDQIFRIENGKAIQESRSSRELGTGKPTQFPGGNWRPDLPVITNVQAFPFWPLILDARAEILAKGKACVPVRGRR
jgi:hypothetical protein